MTERQQAYLLTYFIPGLGRKSVLSHLAQGADIFSILEQQNASNKLAQALEMIKEYCASMSKYGYELITWDDETYPQTLRTISDPPICFFQKGVILENTRMIAVVGTRSMTQYGKSVAEDISQALCDAGCVVVSGFMRGIDTVAHKTVVRLKKPTVAVLGSGFLNPVPPENKSLISSITENGGAIISEYLPDQLAAKYTFPQRNRIVAGLCDTVIVVEAGAKSGALITARIAAEEGRKVLVVPGAIYSTQSVGAHWLIQQGADVIVSIDKLTDQLGIIQRKDAFELSFSTDLEKKIYQCIQKQPIHINDILYSLKLEPQSLIPVVTQLELRGLIKNIGNDTYVVK